MKRQTLLLITALLGIFAGYALDDCELYKQALDTILRERGITSYSNIAVCNMVIDMDRHWFAPDCDEFPEEQEKLKYYDFYKLYQYNEAEYSECLDQLLPKTSEYDNIIFFSQIEDNILLAEFVNNIHERLKRGKFDPIDPMNYDEIISFNRSDRYAILFNADGSIKAVFCRSIMYEF